MGATYHLAIDNSASDAGDVTPATREDGLVDIGCSNDNENKEEALA
jgi:hypothetical protein